MKSLFFRLTVVFVLSLQFLSCTDRFSSTYTVELPQIPQTWANLLGEPLWRLEWLDSDGQRQTADISGNSLKIKLPVIWTNPVTAWPYWPEKNIIPGFMKPAGALFPFDVSGGLLPITWEAGVDAVFYWELAFANDDNLSKIPTNFDWPRFRELFEMEVLNEAVLKDPWLVDWRGVAERTIGSNFDRRRLVPQAVVSVNIPVSSGTWYGTSPFAEPLHFEEGELPVFPVRPGINVWISGEGILRCNGNTWVFN
jgi:hypothetical protein